MNKFLLILILPFYFINAQSSHWFPGELNIQPFTANFLEPKGGFHFGMGSRSDIRLDIGTSRDLYRYEKDNSVISFGGDLFTYTRLRGTEEFHFPVEAIDYLFGINSGYRVSENNNEYGIRFRFSHISAHFVDGHYDYEINNWRNNRIPRVYSREFLEFIPFFRTNGMRLYLGYTYLVHVSPSGLGRSILQTGFDYYYLNNSLPFAPFAAYDLKLSKITAYEANHIITSGIKFGNYNSKGFSILFTYFSGTSVHGEYFDAREQYSTIGFNLDL